MNSFPIVATVISMILGLSITRLLLGLVTVFRIRRSSQADWVPLAWSGVLFEIQLQFWWAVNQLPVLQPTYGFGDFLFLVALPLTLYVSAALILPSRGEDEKIALREYFEADGRYALLALTAFLLLGFLINIFFFRSPMESIWALIDLPMIVLPTLAFFLKERRCYVAITLVYLPLAGLDLWISLAS
ncbi:hypothetical protein NGM99_05860 [Mesorhizobium sp. RP14(2022)]|uniref:Lycopene cyclase domain-containing protein n=1 Tax=Mesorhizobium liriopis TaxID=2953882 RepID=A0ABT1C3B7_9HYPH|nr:hypothetical protein [Mesorhizobium liriopis]MCO6049314.1 hypothetical protein [Mesorhizobium liriopis]